MVLTEFLYQKDEVVASFLLSMVFATDINEAVFFISELYNSGFYDDVYNVIWSLYFDFYYVTNNKLVSYINETILRDLKEKNIQNIHNIVKTLYPKNKCIPVFLLNQNTKIYGENQRRCQEGGHPNAPQHVDAHQIIVSGIREDVGGCKI